MPESLDEEYQRVELSIPQSALDSLRDIYPPDEYPNNRTDADRIREACGEAIRRRENVVEFDDTVWLSPLALIVVTSDEE